MFKLLKRFTLKEIFFVLLDVLFIVVSSRADLKVPDYTKEIALMVQNLGISATIDQVWQVGGKMMICVLISIATSICAGFCSAMVAGSFSKNLRRSLFTKVQSFGQQEINAFSTASLITRSTNDVTQITMVIAMGLHMFIKAPTMITIALINIAKKDVWQWTTATAGAGLAIIICLVIMLCVVLPRFKKMQQLIDDVNRDMRENLLGLKVVRAYNAESYQEGKFEQSNSALAHNQLVAIRTMAFLNPIMNIVQNGLTLAVYWLGAGIIASAGMLDKAGLVGDMVTFSNYASHVVMSFIVLAFAFMGLPRAMISAQRVNEVLDKKTSLKSGEIKCGKVVDGKEMKGVVEFKNVSFKYPDAEDYVLENVSFVANKGETVAFIGSTGSGKSTLINLVPRFFDATEGQVLIDGVDAREYDTECLNDKLGYVPQRAVLFSGTIYQNLTYGMKPDAMPTESDLNIAIDVSQSREFIESRPNKLDEHIAQGGANLSGGQKQRLSIARAVVRKPEIYIFDDSFSALDFKTDMLVRTALKQHAKGSTILMVAQRIGTIKDADKIVVLQEGKMVGIGTHKELLKSCQVYKEIALSQLAEEELAL
ncbi:MAG: ABC transporter ATP-binding protein [Clostridia bacterium]|nr:ABC transporter ATP-binding protein [Clostridia bacterium]